jgi:hypothetical protein
MLTLKTLLCVIARFKFENKASTLTQVQIYLARLFKKIIVILKFLS